MYVPWEYAFLNAINYLSHADVEECICKIKKSVMFRNLHRATNVRIRQRVRLYMFTSSQMPANMNLLDRTCCRAGASNDSWSQRTCN